MTDRKKVEYLAFETSPLFAKHQQEFMTTWFAPAYPAPEYSEAQLNHITDVVSVVLAECTPEIANLDAQVIGTLIIGRLCKNLTNEGRLDFVRDVQEYIRKEGE